MRSAWSRSSRAAYSREACRRDSIVGIRSRRLLPLSARSGTESLGIRSRAVRRSPLRGVLLLYERLEEINPGAVPPGLAGLIESKAGGRDCVRRLLRANERVPSSRPCVFIARSAVSSCVGKPGHAPAFPSRPKQRAGQNHERLVEEARDNGGGFTSGGGLLQFFRQDRPGS